MRAYNDVSRRFNKHAGTQGRPFKEIWHESWPALEVFFNGMEGNTSGGMEDHEIQLFPEQLNGRLEESFWKRTLLPVFGEQGRVAGFYNRATEVTDERVRERRSKTLYAINAPAGDSTDLGWAHLFKPWSPTHITSPWPPLTLPKMTASHAN